MKAFLAAATMALVVSTSAFADAVIITAPDGTPTTYTVEVIDTSYHGPYADKFSAKWVSDNFCVWEAANGKNLQPECPQDVCQLAKDIVATKGGWLINATGPHMLPLASEHRKAAKNYIKQFCK